MKYLEVITMEKLLNLFSLNEVNVWIFKFGRRGKKWHF